MAELRKPFEAGDEGSVAAIVHRHTPSESDLACLRDFITRCGSKKPQHVETADIEVIVAGWKERLTHNSLHSYRMRLAMWLRKLRPYGLRLAVIRRVPMGDAAQARQTVITGEQFEQVLIHADAALRLFLLLCHDAALRADSARQIGNRHYNRETGIITAVTKNKRIIAVPATVRLREIMDRLDDPELSFVRQLQSRTRRGESSLHYLRQCWWHLRKKLGIKQVTLHDLRRTMARNVYQITGDIRQVQMMLGHSSPVTTWRYLERLTCPESLINVVDMAAEWKGER